MISTLLAKYSEFVPWVMLLIALISVVVGYFLLRSGSRGQVVLGVLAVLSALPVLVLALVPVSRDAVESACFVQFSVPRWGAVENVANMALLFPLVFLLALVLRRPLLAFLAGTGLSAGTEAIQALIPPIGRSCDTNDWWMSTLGAGIAAALATVTLALANRRVRVRHRPPRPR